MMWIPSTIFYILPVSVWSNLVISVFWTSFSYSCIILFFLISLIIWKLILWFLSFICFCIHSSKITIQYSVSFSSRLYILFQFMFSILWIWLNILSKNNSLLFSLLIIPLWRTSFQFIITNIIRSCFCTLYSISRSLFLSMNIHWTF